ncbi:MAG: H-type lectin domain-containing protein, partial [Pseudomonadota bacterium]
GTAGGDGSLLDYRSLTLDKVEGGVGTDPIGQAGKLVVAQTDAGAWTTVTFDQPLDNPSVVLGPLSFNDADPATLRVRDVTDTGFQFQIDEWDYLDGIHGAETIQWLALEQGVHEVGGQTIAAGSSTASGNGSLIQLEGTSFGSAPVVLAQIASDNGAAAATAQIESVSNGSFRLDLDREEAASSAHGTEQVDWIAVTPGGDGSDGLQAGSVTRVQDGGKTISLMNGDTDEFVFLSSMQGERIRDAATVRLESQTDDSWRVFIEEEQSLDAETSHGNEKVGYLGIELGLIYADDLLA